MLHYQIYKALADQRTHDLVAAAKRHELIAAARYDSTDATESGSRIEDATARLMALVHLRRDTDARSTSARSTSTSTSTSARGTGSTVTSPSGAVPMGCSA